MLTICCVIYSQKQSLKTFSLFNMNLTLLASALFHVIHLNKVNHCSQLFLLDSISNTQLSQGHTLSEIIGSDVVNYIFISPESFRNNESILSKPTTKFQDPCTLSVSFFNTEISLSTSLITLGTLNKQLIQKEHDFFIFIRLDQAQYIPEKNNVGLLVDFKYKLFITLDWQYKTVHYKTACQYCHNGYPSTLELQIPLFADFLNNFQGKSLRISTHTSTTSLFEIRQSQNIWIPARGYQKFALEHLMKRYNFTSIYFPSVGGGGTGSRTPNGTWVGTVGDILSGRADIGVSSAQIYVRDPYVDFTSPMGYTWLTFTTGKGLPQYSWKSIYWPLSSRCWILVMTSTLVKLVTIKIFPYFRKQEVMPKTINFIVRSLLEQDSVIGCKANSVRVLGSFWLIFGFLITTAYKCKLVSMLAYPVLEEPPKTFTQLADSLHYKISLQYVRGAAYVLLKTSPNPTLKTIFNRMYLEEDSVKCFKDVLGADGAHKTCISWVDISIEVQHRNLSEKMFGNTSPLVMAQETCYFVGLPLMLKKGAVLREIFDTVIHRVVDMGIVEKWKMEDRRILKNERLVWIKNLQDGNITKVIADGNGIIDKSADFQDTLKLNNLMGTFYLVFFGLGISVCAFLFEVIKCFIITTCIQFDESSLPTLLVVP